MNTDWNRHAYPSTRTVRLSWWRRLLRRETVVRTACNRPCCRWEL